MLRLLTSLAIAVDLYLAGTVAASALPVPFVALAFGLAATSFAAIAITAVINIGLAIGLSYLARALMPKPSTPDITSQPGGTTGRLQSGGAVPRSFIVGRAMTAGSLVYANTYSPTSAATTEEIIVAANQIGGWAGAVFPAAYAALQASGNTPNAYLVQVIALSDIPVTGMVGMFVGSQSVTYDTATTPSLEGIPIPEFNSGGKDHLWVRFYDGTQTAADEVLVNLFGTDPDRPYTAARVGNGVAYAVVTSLVNQDLFSGFPQLKFVLDGIKLYDRRYDTSVGGSGSQRWSTPSTWALTSNPVVIAENILRGVSYGGSWVYGAQTVATAQLPSASWTAAASECDVATALAAGGTEAQFSVGGEIRFDVEPASTIEELLKACNGNLAEIGGTYKIRAGAAGSAVFSFTDGDIISTEQQVFEPFPSLGQTINAVTAKYISPAEGWVPKDAAPLYDATLETADGGRRQPVDVSYSFVTSGTQVQRLMKSARDDHRAMRRHALPMPPDAFVLEPLDVISWTSTRNGYSAKLFEIVSAEDLPNLNMGLALKELDPNAYDWTAGTDEQPVIDGTIVVVRPDAQPIVDWNAVPWVIVSDDDRELPGIKLSWDPNSTDVSGVRFEVRIAATAEVIHRGETDRVEAGSIIISQNLISNTAYQARGQYRPRSFRDVTWSDWLDVTTPDVRVILSSFEDGLRDFVTGEFQSVMDRANATASLIASVAAEQDAANWLDKYSTTELINQRVDTINSAIGENSADITTIQSTLVTDEAAFASYQLTVSAQFGFTNANVSTNATAIASLDSSFSSYTTTVNAHLGLLDASVSTNSTAIATISGRLAAQWTLTLDVNNYITGVKAYNDGTTGQFIIITDDFLVAKPGVSGGAPVPVFAISTVGGTAKVVLRGDMVADGTITAIKMVTGTITAASGIIANLAVDTLQLANNAVTVPAAITSFVGVAGTNAFVTALTLPLTFTAPAGSTVNVMAWASAAQGYNGTVNPLYEMQILADGNLLFATGGSSIDASISASGLYAVVATGSSQTVTFQLQWYGSWGFGSNISLGTRTMTAMAVKR